VLTEVSVVREWGLGCVDLTGVSSAAGRQYIFSLGDYHRVCIRESGVSVSKNNGIAELVMWCVKGMLCG
jgi:hypothetical protein